MRINIEDQFWGDVRHVKLCLKLNDEEKATGSRLIAFHLAQKYWIPNRELIPAKEFERIPSHHALIEVGFAEADEQGNIRVKGVEEHFNWWFKCAEGASRGGQASAKARSTHPQGGVNPGSTLVNAPTPTPTPTLPLKKNTYKAVSKETAERLETIFKNYPQRKGDRGKNKGFEKLARILKSEEDFERFEKAVNNYAAHCEETEKTGTAYVKQLPSFISVWTEYEGEADAPPVGIDSSKHWEDRERDGGIVWGDAGFEEQRRKVLKESNAIV